MHSVVHLFVCGAFGALNGDTINRIIIDKSDKKQVDRIKKFYVDNPSTFVMMDGSKLDSDNIYIALEDLSGEIVAVSSLKPLTSGLIEIWSTRVKEGSQGKGYGKRINQEMIDLARSNGYTKICSYSYTNNIPNIVLKLKMGFLIEGLFRDHEEIGSHEYMLSRKL